MGLFGRLFGSKDDVPALRKAIAQRRYADARLISAEIDAEALSDEERSEFNQLCTQAGDSLAQLNLNEGLGLQRSGDNVLALEHLELAQAQAVSGDLIKQIKQALKGVASDPITPVVVKKAAGGSCASCGPVPTTEPLLPSDGDLPDFASQIDLTLASYPAELAERYRHKSVQFQQAFLAAHQEDETTALALLKKVSLDEKDDLFDFEVGSLLGRLGQFPDSIKSLKKALDKNPEHLLAAETLISLLVSRNQGKEALTRLEAMLAKGQDPAFCHTQLTNVRLQMKDRDKALEHAGQALALGSTDPQIMLLVASFMEQNGDVNGAEQLFSCMSASGCGGGANVYLAEFWLRQKINLGKALDSFNAVCRQDPGNPRWQLRVAQTYLARGWDKQGLKLLQRVIPDPQLAPELRVEGEALLASKTKA